jgi:hypothetical protein
MDNKEGLTESDVMYIPEPEDVMQTDGYKPRTEMFDGRKHLVVPVVLMVSGVHNGSHGPVLHTEDDLAKYPASWNGIPVVVQHPEENGVNVSANSPEILDQAIVGRVFGTRFDEGKLRAEVWLDEKRLSRISPESLECIRNQAPLEVSVGVFTDDEEVEGRWGDETYTAVSHNHRPDHLALLPGSKGACSWDDGCGIRANKEGGNVNEVKVNVSKKAGMEKGDLMQLIDSLRSLVDAKGTISSVPEAVGYSFLEEVYDDSVVYCTTMPAGEKKYFKQSYKTKDDGTVELVDDAVEVKKEVKFQTNEPPKKGGIDQMAEKKKGCCPEKVELLIQSEVMSFDEDQRDWLEGLDEDQVDNLLELENSAQALQDENTTLKEQVASLEARVADLEKLLEEKNVKANEAAPQMNTDQAIKVLKDHLSDPARFLQLLPDETRKQMEHGLRLHKAYREDLISKIQTNAPEEVYTEDELRVMEDRDLERLNKLVKPKVDYSLFGGKPVQSMESQVAPLLPPGVKVAA